MTDQWLEIGIGSPEMVDAASTLEEWFGWNTRDPIGRGAIRDCHELAAALAAVEGAAYEQEVERRMERLAALSDDPTIEELDAFAATEEGFEALVEWRRNDACAPTGAPSIDRLRGWAAQYGYDEWTQALSRPWDLI